MKRLAIWFATTSLVATAFYLMVAYATMNWVWTSGMFTTWDIGDRVGFMFFMGIIPAAIGGALARFPELG